MTKFHFLSEKSILMKTVFVNFGCLLTYFEECQLFIYIFRANVSCLFTFSATCLHCQLFVNIFNQAYIIVSAVCLHCQLSVYIFNCLFTFSTVCLHCIVSCLFTLQFKLQLFVYNEDFEF